MPTIYDKEADISKLKDDFAAIVDYLESAVGCEQMHDVEKHVFKKLHLLGLSLLASFVKQSGTGYQADSSPRSETGEKLQYKGLVASPYFSIFGELRLQRAAYAAQSGKYYYPIDAQLNLPAQKYSYLLEKWVLAHATETDFREALTLFNELFDFSFFPAMAKRMCAKVAKAVDRFYEHAAAPSPESEGTHLAISADGKGVPILQSERAGLKHKQMQPKARRQKGEKPGIKKQAVVTVDFSFDPGPRNPEQIVKALLNEYTREDKKQMKAVRAKRRQQGVRDVRVALNKHARATFAGKEKAMNYLMERIKKRDQTDQKPVVALIDGDPSLEQALYRAVNTYQLDGRLDAVILDIIHVSEYIWKAGTALLGEKSHKRVAWVRKRLLAILHGHTGRVIGGLRQTITKNKLKPSQQTALQAAITYLSNHQHMMHYNVYLAKGYPIATGLVEAACGSLVKDRMERSGMRWSIHGAQSVLDQRAVKKNMDWQQFWQYYIESERKRCYADSYKRAA